MNEVSLPEAWRLWFTGDLPPGALIWGVSVFWWGRLGKLMQFVGAVTIIADIIGPERIRRFGASLHTAVTRANLIQFLKLCFEWYVVIFRHTLMKDYAETKDYDEPATRKNVRHLRINAINYIVCFATTILIILLARLYSAGWIVFIEAAIIFACLLVSVSPLITVLAIALFVGFELALNAFLVQPLAWALEHPSFDRFIKVFSLLTLLTGFHFELLAS